MFTKKYIFEAKKTKGQKVFIALAPFILTAISIFIFLCIYLPVRAERLTTNAIEAFYQKSPDLIVIFTGGSGRIEYGLKRSEDYPNAHFYISGVHANNSLKTILEYRKNNIEIDDYLKLEANSIDLDYFAKNTVENVMATLAYIKDNPIYKNVLIISSDYHLVRIQTIMNRLNGQNTDIIFYYEGVTTDFSNWRNLKVLFSEIYKLFKTSVFLLFWDQENAV